MLKVCTSGLKYDVNIIHKDKLFEDCFYLYKESEMTDIFLIQTAVKSDKKMVKRINTLIKEAMREPFEGIGSPEALKHSWTGYWSRRLDREHRLVYTVVDGDLVIAQCRYHF